LLQVIHDHMSECLNWENQVFEQISSAENVNDLKAIEI
jgi:hypothetical protein